MGQGGHRQNLYKIRRLVKREDGKGERFEWWAGDSWVDDPIDVLPDTYKVCSAECERFKVRNKDPNVLYHTVVPA